MTKKKEVGMTNEQSRRLEILARIDELERINTQNLPPEFIENLEQRKKALRSELNT